MPLAPRVTVVVVLSSLASLSACVATTNAPAYATQPALMTQVAPAPVTVTAVVESPQVVAVAPPSVAVAPDVASGTASVTWINPQTTSGCFFFSGPGTLGRDTHLGTSAQWTIAQGQVSLAFSPDAVFHGSIRGSLVALRRDGTYSFGTPWRTEETLVGAVSNGTFQGEYEYKECNTAPGSACPGTCTIRASVILRW